PPPSVAGFAPGRDSGAAPTRAVPHDSRHQAVAGRIIEILGEPASRVDVFPDAPERIVTVGVLSVLAVAALRQVARRVVLVECGELRELVGHDRLLCEQPVGVMAPMAGEPGSERFTDDLPVGVALDSDWLRIVEADRRNLVKRIELICDAVAQACLARDAVARAIVRVLEYKILALSLPYQAAFSVEGAGYLGMGVLHAH